MLLYFLTVTLICVCVSHGQLISACTKNNGFCIPLRERCPQDFKKDPRYSNFYGCSSAVKQCCVYDRGDNDGVLSRAKCGLGSATNRPRILNGAPTGVCDWPFVVSIRSLSRDNGPLTFENTAHACAGVLINSDWVLTSPFCILSAGQTLAELPAKMVVVAGEYNVSRVDIDPLTGRQQEQFINVDAAYLEPRYPYTSLNESIPFMADPKLINSHAIAMLHLAEPITGECSGIVCLPTELEAANDCASYDQCVILGWGFITETIETSNKLAELKRGRIQLTSRSACDFLTKRMNWTEYRPAGSICQSPRGIDTDSCLGDEGGPVLCATGNNWVVRGILPFNICSNTMFSLFATEVAPSLAWIQSTMARHST